MVDIRNPKTINTKITQHPHLAALGTQSGTHTVMAVGGCLPERSRPQCLQTIAAS